MNLFHYVPAGIHHACLLASLLAKPLELTPAKETFLYSCSISRDVCGIFSANSSEFGIGGAPEAFEFSNPAAKMPPKWVSSGAGLPANGESVRNEARNQPAHTDSSRKPSDEFSDTHKLLFGLIVLIIGLLAVQWATWDVVRRIYHKLNEMAP